jgi:transcriptional regulator with XRE-family HTH domain
MSPVSPPAPRPAGRSPVTGGAPQPLGPLLVRLRSDRGWSQSTLAARLCAAAGVPTLSRHEVSRWERGQRVPGEFWRGWLAVVLDSPPERLVGAATRSRRTRSDPALGTGGHRGRTALLTLAGRWLAEPAGGVAVCEPETDGPTGGEAPGGPAGGEVTGVGPAGGEATGGGPAGGGVETDGTAGLRRLDDLVGGGDLSRLGGDRLRRAVTGLTRAGRADRRRMLPAVAEAAQLAGWLAADAGDPAGALDAYRLGLRAATAAGDRRLAGYVLGTASHLLAGLGDPAGALRLARTGYAGIRRDAPPGLRALLLHRIAFAAASVGRHRLAYDALGAAQREADRHEPAGEPAWLYWLDRTEFAAMTGRTLVVLGRPLRATVLLRAARHPDRPRSSALYGAWLALGCLQLGEVEQACAAADAALLDTVRSSSVRAVAQVATVHRRLAAHPGTAAVRRHADLLAAARPYLPRAGRPCCPGSAPAVRRGHYRPASVMA